MTFEINNEQSPRLARGSHWVGHWSAVMRRNQAWTSPMHPGVVIRHCGHPTALYPYYCEGLAELSGRTFRTLRAAQTCVDNLRKP